MTYQDEMARIAADTARIRQIGERFKAEATAWKAEDATWNPNINAPTAPVVEATEHQVDWGKVGAELDQE